MEDIKFNKFVCYILTCIDAPNKQYVYVNGKYYVKEKKDPLGTDSGVKLIDYNKLNSIISTTGTDFTNFQNTKDDKISKLNKMKPYINVQYVPDYIVDDSDNTILNIKQSIYQIFNILKTSFDAKKWYIDSNFTPNKLSPQNTVKLTSQFIGGDPTEYELFLQDVINAFILLLNKDVDKSSDLIMYVLSKINYYIAKEYVKLVFNKVDPAEQADANKPYEKLELTTDIKIYSGKYDDDKFYKQYYQKEILDTMNIYVEKEMSDSKSETTNLFKSGDKAVVKLFNTIKPFLKKQPTVFYQTPITTYTYNPTNIRPLIYRRASEYDLSNFATQIASDAFLNKNKLPVIYDFKEIMKPMTMSKSTGGGSDVNNSSNVYRTIYVKILNMLNAKRITLDKDDKEAIEKKLNDLEQLERELKEQLGDYAKYASASHNKYETVDYSKVKQFLNDYEDKIKKYNSDSAKIVRFISRLTPYLY